MPDLIPLSQHTIDNESIQTVNARDLHAFLGVKRDFSNWIKQRIQTYGFKEGRDFTRSPDLASGNTNPPIEYFVSFAMAKELSMVERTKKGKEAREYFIACEKALLTQHDHQDAILDMYPELKTIRDMAHTVISLVTQAAETRRRAEEASTRADEAHALAQHAINAQQWLSIRQWVFLNRLERQMPPAVQADYGRWLTGYCQEHNIPVHNIGVADRSWSTEHAYHVGTLQATLPNWVLRRNGQPPLPLPEG